MDARIGALTREGDALDVALRAARLLGRWSLIAQRHGAGCSCCPGLGDVSMEEVEKKLLESLSKHHALLQNRDSLTGLLRECVSREPDLVDQAEPLRALFQDLGGVIEDLENIQRGLW